MHGDEIRDFFSDSCRAVEILDRRIVQALGRSRAGLTLNELISEALEEFPEWPVDTRDLAMFPVKGHLERLESRGRIRVVPGNPPPSLAGCLAPIVQNAILYCGHSSRAVAKCRVGLGLRSSVQLSGCFSE